MVMNISGLTQNKIDNLLNSLAIKQDELNESIESKTNSLEGYEKAYVHLDPNGDADTYQIQLLSGGEAFAGRLDGAYVDTVEKSRTTPFGTDISENPYKRNQLMNLSYELGKPINEITDTDMANYSNYSLNTVASFIDGQQTSSTKYDPSVTYDSSHLKNSSYEVWVKVGGMDATNTRRLVDIRTPTSTLSKMLEQDANINLNAKFEPHLDSELVFGEKENEITESIDIAQASIAKHGAAFADFILPDSIAKAKFNGYSIQDIAYNDGIADEIFGRNYVNKKDLQASREQADKDYKEGNYLDWATTTVANFLPAAAESAGFLATNAVGALLSKPTGGLSIAAAITVNTGARTAQTMEEYKKNNGGKEMPKSEAVALTAANTLLSFGEYFVGGAATRFIPGVGRIFNKIDDVAAPTTVRGVIGNATKSGAVEAVSEFPEELVDNIISTYFSQDQTKKRGVLDVATDSETIQRAFEGSLSAGPMSATTSAITGTAGLATKPANKALDAVEKKAKEKTFERDVAKAAINANKGKMLNKIVKELEGFDVTKSTPEALTKTLDDLTGDIFNTGLSEEQSSIREAKVIELVQEARKAGVKIDYNKYVDVQSLDAQTVRGSIKQRLDLAKVSNIDELSPKERDNLINAVAEETGLDVEEVRHIVSIDDVSLEVEYGEGSKKGYRYYDNRLTSLTTELNTEGKTKAEKTAISSQIKAVTDKLTYLQQNQIGKAEQLMKGMELLVKSKKDVLVDYQDGTVELADGRTASEGQFKIDYDYVSGNSSKDAQLRERAIFSLLPDVLKNVSDMDAILAKHGIENTTTDRDSILERFEDLVLSVDEGLDNPYNRRYASKSSQKPSKAPKVEDDVQVTKSKTEAEGVTEAQTQRQVYFKAKAGEDLSNVDTDTLTVVLERTQNSYRKDAKEVWKTAISNMQKELDNRSKPTQDPVSKKSTSKSPYPNPTHKKYGSLNGEHYEYNPILQGVYGAVSAARILKEYGTKEGKQKISEIRKLHGSGIFAETTGRDSLSSEVLALRIFQPWAVDLDDGREVKQSLSDVIDFLTNESKRFTLTKEGSAQQGAQKEKATRFSELVDKYDINEELLSTIDKQALNVVNDVKENYKVVISTKTKAARAKIKNIVSPLQERIHKITKNKEDTKELVLYLVDKYIDILPKRLGGNLLVYLDNYLNLAPAFPVNPLDAQPEQQVVNQNLEPENQSEEQIEYTDEVPDWVTEEVPVDDLTPLVDDSEVALQETQEIKDNLSEIKTPLQILKDKNIPFDFSIVEEEVYSFEYDADGETVTTEGVIPSELSDETRDMIKQLQSNLEDTKENAATQKDYNIINTYPTLISRLQNQLKVVGNKLKLKEYDLGLIIKELDTSIIPLQKDVSDTFETLNKIIKPHKKQLEGLEKQLVNLRSLATSNTTKAAQRKKEADTIKLISGKLNPSLRVSFNNALRAYKRAVSRQQEAELKVASVIQEKEALQAYVSFINSSLSTDLTALNSLKGHKSALINELKEDRLNVKSLKEEIKDLQQVFKEAKERTKEASSAIPAVHSAIALDTTLTQLAEAQKQFTPSNSLDYGQQIILANTVKPSNKASNVLALAPYADNGLVNKIKKQLFNILKNPVVTPKGDNIRNGLLKELQFSPALGLLYDFSTLKENVKVKDAKGRLQTVPNTVQMDNNTVMAIYYSVMDVLNDDYIFRPSIDALDSLNVGEEVTDDVKTNFIANYGVFRSTVADALGAKVLEVLGLEKNYSRSNPSLSYNRNSYEAVVSNMGNIVLVLMEDMKLIDTFQAADINNATSLNVTGSTVRLAEFKKRQYVGIFENLQKELDLGVVNHIRTPLKVMPNKLTEATAKDPSIELSPEYVEALNNENSTPWTLERELIEDTFYTDGKRDNDKINAYLGLAGYIFDLDSLSFDDYCSATGFTKRPTAKDLDINTENLTEEQVKEQIHAVEHESTVGSNGSLKKELNALLDLYEENYEGPYFFEHFISNVGRIFKRGTPNAQTSKHFARTLMRSGNTTQNLDMGNRVGMWQLYFSIATAFDYAKSDIQIDSLALDLLNGKIPINKIKEALLTGNKDALKAVDERLGIETVGHVLLAVNTIESYQKAKANGKPSFAHSMTTEADAVTSGYMHRHLQYANQGPEVLSRVGIYADKEQRKLTMNQFKNSKDENGKLNLDTYQAIGREYEPVDPMLEDSFLDKYFVNPFQIQKSNPKVPVNTKGQVHKYIVEAANNFINSLFKSTVGREGGAILQAIKKDEAIPSALRALAKALATPLGYGSGRYSSTQTVGRSVLDKNISNFYKLLNSTDKDLSKVFDNAPADIQSVRDMMVTLYTILADTQITEAYSDIAVLREEALGYWKETLKTTSLKHLTAQLPKGQKPAGKDSAGNTKWVDYTLDVTDVLRWKNTSYRGSPNYLQINAYSLLSNMYSQTVGAGILKAANKLYPYDRGISNRYNNLYNVTGQLYAKVLVEGKKYIRTKNNGVIPQIEWDAFVRQIEPLLPTVTSALGTSFPVVERVTSVDNNTIRKNVTDSKGNVTGTEEKVVTYTIGKKDNSRKEGFSYTTTTASTYDYSNAATKATVIAIQSLDGAAMLRTINELREVYGIYIGSIHDAINAPVEVFNLFVKVFSKHSLQVNLEHSIFRDAEQMVMDQEAFIESLKWQESTKWIYNAYKEAEKELNTVHSHMTVSNRKLIGENATGIVAKDDFDQKIKDDRGEDVILSLNEVRSQFFYVASQVEKNRMKQAEVAAEGMSCANIAGTSEGVYNTLEDNPSELAANEFKEVSGSTGHITPESAKRITGKGLTNRLELFDILAEKATEDDKHLKEVRDDLATFDDVLFDNMETAVDIVTEEFPSGTYNSKKHKINLSVPAVIDHLSTVQSTAITYAHELYHAITDTVITRHAELGASNEIRQLQRVYARATKELDYTAFLPTRKDKKGNVKKPTERDVQLAKNAWEYVFEKGELAEFVAYAKTNESFRKALKDVKLFTREDKSSMTLLEKVVDVVNNLLKVFVSAIPFSQVFPGVSGIITGDASKKILNMDALQAVDHLVKQIGAINAKYIKEQNKDTKGMFAYFETIKDWLESANGYVSKHIRNLLNLAEKLGIKAPKLIYKDTDGTSAKVFKLAQFVSKLVGMILVSPNTRKGVINGLSRIPFGLFTGWSFVASFIRDITVRSKEGQELDNYSAMTKRVENDAMQVYGSTAAELKDAFGRELSVEEDTSLTQVALASDLSALSDLGVDYIQEVARNEKKLLDDIVKLEGSILSKTKRNRHIGFQNYTKLLANYMVNKVGNEALLTNATQIARKLGMSKQVKDIDKLISLKALYYTDKNLRNTLSTLPKEGLTTFLALHNSYKEISLDNDGAHEGNVVKGWFKTKPTDNYRTMWDLASNKDVLAKEDWTLVVEKKNGMAYYRHNYSERPTRDGSGFVSRGAYQASTAVHEFSNSSVSEKLTKAKMSTEGAQRLNRVARARFKGVTKAMLAKPMSVEQMTKGGTGLLPIMNGKNTPNWFSASLTTEERNNVLNTEQRGITVLSEMMSSFVLWQQSKPLNENLLEFLKMDQARNFPVDRSLLSEDETGTITSLKDATPFVLLREDSPHKYIRDYYGALPLNVRKYIADGNELAVRQEFVAELIGVPSFALTDTKFVKAITNTQTRRYMALVGTFVKELAKFVKQTIVVRMVGVVIDNILGNMSTAFMYGLNPLTVIKETFAAFRNTKEYVKDRKEYGALQMKIASGRATDKDKAIAAQLDKKMKLNPVHPLMEQGLYQSIVEDLQDTSYPLTSKGIQWVQSNLLSKAPSVLEKSISQAYELEGTGIYNFLFEVVQYTDFAARAAHYKMLMERYDRDTKKTKGSIDLVERAKVSRAAISRIREIYINYNRPNSQVEQYLDDLGLFMFIKYAKRVNGVILKGIIERPISVAIGGFSQAYVMDTPDMLEGNIFARDFSNNMHTPWSNFMTAITPSLPREVLGAV